MSAEDEWEFDKSMGLLDASPEEYRAATGFGSAREIFKPRDKEADLKYLRDLQNVLWPDDYKAVRELEEAEVRNIFKIIKAWGLLTEMFSANMFGGYGIAIYEHENYPGTGPNLLLSITEFDLPAVLNSKYKKAAGGSGSDDAWRMFTEFTHSDKNKEWLKMYKMSKPRERSYYDY